MNILCPIPCQLIIRLVASNDATNFSGVHTCRKSTDAANQEMFQTCTDARSSQVHLPTLCIDDVKQYIAHL